MKFIELLDRYNVPHREAHDHHHVTDGWIGLDCPACSRGTNKFRLGYNLEKRYCVCWSCGPQRLIDVLQELTGLSPSACFTLMGGIDFAKYKSVKFTGKLELPNGLVDLLPRHMRYLDERGLNPKEMQRIWRLQGIGAHGDFPWSIFIPVFWRSEMVSWTVRRCTDKLKARYVNARVDQERLPAKSLLFGMDYVRHTAIVVEGPFDAFAIGPGAVATGGINVSTEQIGQLSKLQKVIVCFDNEPMAQRRAENLCNALAPIARECVRIVLDAPDPGSAPECVLRLLRDMIR